MTKNSSFSSIPSRSQLIKTIKSLKKEVKALKAENDHLNVAHPDAEVIPLRQVINTIPANIYWKDKTGTYLGCNNNVAKLLGLTAPEDVIGKHNNDFPCLQPFVKELNKNDQAIMRGKKGKFYEEAGVTINNKPTTYLSHKIPITNSADEIVGLLGISLDIHKQKKMEDTLILAKEKAEAANQAKSQFLAIVTHELRTPLSCIIELIEFLKQENISLNEKKEMATLIDNSAHYLLELVNNILDLSKLEAEKYSTHFTNTNLYDIVQEIYVLLKKSAEKKGLALQIDLSKDVPKHIWIDPTVLRQILINLINNAIKFTEKGHVILQISTLGQQNNKITLKITVTDTGIGIPANKFNAIFNSFEQLEDIYTRQSSRGGTGLGLAIVKKLVESIDANIQVNSTLHQGSSFSVIGEFEIVDGVSAEISQQEQKKLTSIKTNCRVKQTPYILLVEDDPIVQYIHKKIFTDLGCRIDIASHGCEVPALFDKHNMIFIDLSLPDINGFEIIRLLRKQHSAERLPIIVLTAYTGKEEKIMSLDAGANEFISKPISKNNLKKVLARYLG